MVSAVTSSGDHPCDLDDLLYFPVDRYVDQYGHQLDGRRFSVMRLAGDVCEIHEARSGCSWNIALRAWITLWSIWGGCVATYISYQYSATHSLYNCCFANFPYEGRLSDIWWRLGSIECSYWANSIDKVIWFPIQKNELASFQIGVDCSGTWNSNCGMGIHKGAALVSWYNLELLVVPRGTTSCIPCVSIMEGTWGLLPRSSRSQSSGFGL